MARVATVFGGSGFIGRYLVRHLAREGWQVRVPSRNPEAAKFLKPYGDVGQITPLRLAAQDADGVARAVDGADAVINLIGLLAEGGAQRFSSLHCGAPDIMARAAAAGGARSFVQVSAIGADLASPSLYARTKAQGEATVRAAFADAVILRPSIVFGPEDRFFNRFAAMASLSPILPLIGGGHSLFQPVYVDDVARAVVAALDQPSARAKTYELGGPQVLSFKELMEVMLAVIHRRRVLLPLPFAVAELLGTVLQWVPGAPLTRDQVILLKGDTVVGKGALGLEDLGVVATGMDLILPAYLARFRPGGRLNPASV